MDNIHALSSGPLPSGVAVIRISGAGTFNIVRRLIGTRRLPPARQASLRNIYNPQSHQLLDQALLLIFPGPHSFTGEDVAEIHCHGSPAVVAAVQAALGELGSRPAEAGEFTRRAFQSGRIDLTQAEALSDLIAAETEAQREQALQQAGGRLREAADLWREQLIAIMAEIEAGLDFADEGDVSDSLLLSEMSRSGPLNTLEQAMQAGLKGSKVAERVRHGLTIAIVGPPNAGKSSLINMLSGRSAAIVTPYAGTTRDVIEVHLDLAGRPAVLLDTAGIRETNDPIEAEGILRARERAAAADLVLDLGADGNVVNRIDESGEDPGLRNGRIFISARTGAGIPEFEEWLADWARAQIPTGEPPLVTTARQVGLISEALKNVREARLQSDPVLAAEALRTAAHALGRLTGHIDPETILGAIFGRFCIGK
jgi:tRNA modification GTPase